MYSVSTQLLALVKATLVSGLVTIYTGLTAVFSHQNVTCITSARCHSLRMNPPPRPRYLQPFASVSRQCLYVLSLYLNVPCTCFLSFFFFVPSVAISRGLISNPTMAPETRCFTEIYCDKASRPSPRGDRSTRLGSAFPPSSMHTAITVLIIITTGGTHTHTNAQAQAQARTYRRCYAFAAQSRSCNNPLGLGSDGRHQQSLHLTKRAMHILHFITATTVIRLHLSPRNGSAHEHPSTQNLLLNISSPSLYGLTPR